MTKIIAMTKQEKSKKIYTTGRHDLEFGQS
jgi:hypothetical protein